MNNYTGLKVKLYLAKITEAGDPILLAGQRDATLNIELAEIDVSSKDSEGGWNEVIGGNRSWNISASGAHTLGDEAYELIEESMITPVHDENIGKLMAYLTTPSEVTYIGRVLITSASKTAPQPDLVTYSITANGDGPLTKGTMPTFTSPVSFSIPVIAEETKTTKGAK